ncbi:hypothetical protein E1264_33170 [Actinomadura sp. KC216]|uniref:hypothetical protein n=1 Tax=Actinomadura sp. KC216 TaxID=2530370 RepID=UPI00104909A4|nr:hypothetical protein [Actinomadura sp. KC216]TDB81142.1 hypothetical protein E1264_33170 [Actinomadura sp. KC216]
MRFPPVPFEEQQTTVVESDRENPHGLGLVPGTQIRRARTLSGWAGSAAAALSASLIAAADSSS